MQEENAKFQRAIFISGILHLILFVIFLLGVPTILEKFPEEQDTVTFEMVTITDISNIQTQNVNPQISESSEIEKSIEVKKSTTSEKPEPVISEPIVTPDPVKSEEQEEPETSVKQAESYVVPEEKALVQKEPVPEVKQLARPEEDTTVRKEPVPEVKQQVKMQATKPINKDKKAKKDQDTIDSILKNLEQESNGNDKTATAKNINTKPAGKIFSRGDEYNAESPLSITEKMLIKNKCNGHSNKK